jgi:hypothetical protein
LASILLIPDTQHPLQASRLTFDPEFAAGTAVASIETFSSPMLDTDVVGKNACGCWLVLH